MSGDLKDERITTVGLLFESAFGIRRAFDQRLATELDLSGQSFEVLIRLARSPGQRLRMSDLATQTTLSPSGLTRAVDRLVEAGLITRETCPEDRRGAFAVLTPAGVNRMETALPLHLRHIDELFSGVFDPDEVAALTTTLRKLRDRLQADAADIPLQTGCTEGDGDGFGLSNGCYED